MVFGIGGLSWAMEGFQPRVVRVGWGLVIRPEARVMHATKAMVSGASPKSAGATDAKGRHPAGAHDTSTVLPGNGAGPASRWEALRLVAPDIARTAR